LNIPSKLQETAIKILQSDSINNAKLQMPALQPHTMK